MMINADHSERVVIETLTLPWVGSPMPGVFRRMLERDGEEQARATSIVRYEAGAGFEPHTHTAGEEILVLEGTFEDEHGEYPAGTYIKNPAGSSHRPCSTEGCTIFVKLRYLKPEDVERVVVRPQATDWRPGMVEGLAVLPLSEFMGEHTALVRWQPGTVFSPHRHFGGEEIFVLEGNFQDEFGAYPKGTWLRNPHMSAHHPFSHTGCTILVKVGHLDVA